METQSLEGVLRHCDEELARHNLRPEDVELRFRLLGPLEREMVAAASIPQASPVSPAARIAKLFWYKAHPEQLDPNEVVPLLADAHSIVRLTAADTVAATLETASQKWADPKVLQRVRSSLERQHVREPSAFLAFQLETLLDRTAKLARLRKATAPADTLNPYVAGPAIRDKEKFFGRQDVLREITTVLAQGDGTRSIILHGARRTGKSSLLYRITDGALGESFVPVYVDMQAVAGTSVENFLSTVIRAIESKAQMPQENLLLYSADFAQLSACLRQALQRIEPRCLIVLFDEYEVLQDFIKEKGFARQMQSLVENATKLFFVFAGSTKVEALRQKQFLFLLDNAKNIKISFLNRHDAYRLITEPVKDVIRFADGVTDCIHDHCSGHPFYTQALCQSLFEIAQGRGTITVEHVEQAVRKFMENPAPHLVLSWNALELDKKIVLSALAGNQAGTDPPAAKRFTSASDVEEYLKTQDYSIRFRQTEIQEVFSALREEDWITKKEGDQRYRFTMFLVQRWVGEHRSIWDVLTVHRKSLTSYMVGAGMRGIAATLDFVGLIILAAVVFAICKVMRVNADGAGGHWLSLLPSLYFSIPMVLFSSTAGMLIFGMRVLSESGSRLSYWRTMSFAALRSTPAFLAINAGFFFADEEWLPGWTCTALAILVAGFHWALTVFTKSRRGLFDKLVRAVVVKPPREQK